MASRCACKVGLCTLVLSGALGLLLKVARAGTNKDCELKTFPAPTPSRFFAAALRAWSGCNEYMPSRVIVYRDGVGDGQLKTLVNYEVPQFLDCLKSVGRGYK